MADASASRPINRLLAALPREELDRITPLLTEIPLVVRENLYAANEEPEYVWFVHSGVVSLLTELVEGAPVEIATVGPEGMVGIQVFLKGTLTSKAFTQVAGSAAQMDAAAFEQAIAENPTFQLSLLRYTTALFNQVSQSAACNRMHEVQERLARWLLMTQDRVHSTTFDLTQEFIAQMLGVRRPTVSIATGMLIQAGLIIYTRGRVTVLNREGLEAAACECYGAIRREFDRLVGSHG